MKQNEPFSNCAGLKKLSLTYFYQVTVFGSLKCSLILYRPSNMNVYMKWKAVYIKLLFLNNKAL